MKPQRRTKDIHHAVSSRQAFESLREAQDKIAGLLKSIVIQLTRQADSTFDGKPWSVTKEIDPTFELGNFLMEWGSQVAALGYHYNSGKLPQWVLDQREAYAQSAIGQLLQQSEQQKGGSNETV